MTRLAKIAIFCLLVTGTINLCVEIYIISINVEYSYSHSSAISISIFYIICLLLSISPSVVLVKSINKLQKHNKPLGFISTGSSIISILVTIVMIRAIFVAEAQPFHDSIYILELFIIFVFYLFWP